MILAGVDIGNSTTEVCIGECVGSEPVRFLSSASVLTTGTKGTPANIHGIKAALTRAMASLGRDISEISLIRLNEAAPVIGATIRLRLQVPDRQRERCSPTNIWTVPPNRFLILFLLPLPLVTRRLRKD